MLSDIEKGHASGVAGFSVFFKFPFLSSSSLVRRQYRYFRTWDDDDKGEEGKEKTKTGERSGYVVCSVQEFPVCMRPEYRPDRTARAKETHFMEETVEVAAYGSLSNAHFISQFLVGRWGHLQEVAEDVFLPGGQLRNGMLAAS